MTARRFDPLAMALAGASWFAGSAIADRLGLRKPTENLAYVLTRRGFRVAKSAARTFQAAGRLLQPLRPGRPERRADLFDLNLTDEQQMIRDHVRQFADGELRPAAGAADEACETPVSLLAAANALGIAAMAVPEGLGGAGGERSAVTGIIVAEELARGDMGMAVAILAPIGVANALSLWGTADQQERYLPPFVAGGVFPAALAVSEPTPLFDPFRLSTRAARDGDSFVLNGTKALVPLAQRSELLLVAADLEGEGPAVFIVERGLAGIAASPDPGMGIRAASLGRVELSDVRLPVEARLGAPYEAVVDLARLGWSALAVGTAQAVLDYVIPYVNERIAFGEPVSHRQSVAFLVSNIAIELESMRLLAEQAAGRVDRDLGFHRQAHLARTLAAEKAMTIGTDGVQLLGGHGFIKEHPVERWYRDLRSVGVMEGGVLV